MSTWRVVSAIPRRLKQAEIPLLSASLAFSTILSLIPFLAVGFAILQKLAGFDSLAKQFELFVLAFFKSTAGAETSLILKKVLGRLSKSSWTITSAAVLFITSLKLFLDMELAVNRIWSSKGQRKFWHRWLMVLGFYLAVPVGLSLYAALRSANFLRPIFAWNPAMWDAMVAFGLLMFVNVHIPAPKVQTLPAVTGAVTSAVGLFVLQSSFSWLTKAVFNYSKIYGSLAAVPLLCLYILIAWQIVLFGVALAAGLQNPVGHRRI